ncbi:MAG: glycosyltransferase family 2 protein [Dyadobacter fermentans]
MGSAPATSLIIATYNWAEALHCSLLSVLRQKTLPVEVIIADDGSDHRTRDLIARMQQIFPVPIIHVWHEDRGFRKSEILNRAVRQTSGTYVVQVDGDVVLHASFIQDHIAAAERGAFVRGTRARLNPARTEELLKSTEAKMRKTTFRFYLRGVDNRLNAVRLPVFRSLGQRREMKSRSVRGSNLAYWKDDFLRVNGYNNELSGWGHEDEELAARFINNNIIKKIVKLSAVQYHLHHDELPRSNEPFHREAVQQTLLTKVKKCLNGYENLL